MLKSVLQYDMISQVTLVIRGFLFTFTNTPTQRIFLWGNFQQYFHRPVWLPNYFLNFFAYWARIWLPWVYALGLECTLIYANEDPN